MLIPLPVWPVLPLIQPLFLPYYFWIGAGLIVGTLMWGSTADVPVSAIGKNLRLATFPLQDAAEALAVIASYQSRMPNITCDNVWYCKASLSNYTVPDANVAEKLQPAGERQWCPPVPLAGEQCHDLPALTEFDEIMKPSAAEPLEVFELAGPVLGPYGVYVGDHELTGVEQVDRHESWQNRTFCEEKVLMQHTFSNSYGKPFVASYKPTSCLFNRVLLNLTVTSEGRQFDRLAHLFLNDVEIWRTSTAEPKPSPGISWTHWKDATAFLSLWKKPQQVIFDLGNLVNSDYTGSFNVTLTASFWNTTLPGDGTARSPPADEIVPVSTGRHLEHQPSTWSFPKDTATTGDILLPRNLRRAVFTVAATGQGDEEFWWSNVPESLKSSFNKTVGDLPALSSLREVRLLIDNEIAGYAWPTPVIFTGGVAPPLHRPVVSPDAFDLPELEIDISPWLGVLCNGKNHTFSLEVLGWDDTDATNGTFRPVPESWILTGKIFLWHAEPNSITNGSHPTAVASPTIYRLGTGQADGRLNYWQSAGRFILHTSNITYTAPGGGEEKHELSWVSAYRMINAGVLANDTNYQFVNATYEAKGIAVKDDEKYYWHESEYPLMVRQVYTVGDDELSLDVDLHQGKHVTSTGDYVFASGIEPFLTVNGSHKYEGTSLKTQKRGTASWSRKGMVSSGHGSTETKYRLSGAVMPQHQLLRLPSDDEMISTSLYYRQVKAANDTVLEDEEWYKHGKDKTSQHHRGAAKVETTLEAQDFATDRGLFNRRFRQVFPDV